MKLIIKSIRIDKNIRQVELYKCKIVVDTVKEYVLWKKDSGSLINSHYITRLTNVISN